MKLNAISRWPTPQQVRLRRRIAMLGWCALVVLACALGLIGVLLPVMPTVPFMMLAAWSASKGWPAFEHWLLRHRLFGPPIVPWRERGAVPRRVKWFSRSMMGVSAAGMQWVTALPLGGG